MFIRRFWTAWAQRTDGVRKLTATRQSGERRSRTFTLSSVADALVLVVAAEQSTNGGGGGSGGGNSKRGRRVVVVVRSAQGARSRVSAGCRLQAAGRATQAKAGGAEARSPNIAFLLTDRRDLVVSASFRSACASPHAHETREARRLAAGRRRARARRLARRRCCSTVSRRTRHEMRLVAARFPNACSRPLVFARRWIGF